MVIEAKTAVTDETKETLAKQSLAGPSRNYEKMPAMSQMKFASTPKTSVFAETPHFSAGIKQSGSFCYISAWEFMEHGKQRADINEATTNKLYTRRRLVNKKGYFQFIEIAMVILLVATFFFVFFPRAEISYQKFNDANNLEHIGFGVLKSMDGAGVFENYIAAITEVSNFTAMSWYIKDGLPATIDSQVEFATNSTYCYSENGAPINCGLNITNSPKFNVVRADFTYSKRTAPITIHLFLWRKL